jgi:hypothetical protein
MIRDTPPKSRRAKSLGWVAMALLFALFGYSFMALRAALDEREALPAALASIESAGQEARQERQTLDLLGEVLERSIERMKRLREAATSPGAGPFTKEVPARWQAEITDERERLQIDQAFLSQLASAATGPAASLVTALRDQLTVEDFAWETVGQYLAARHEQAPAAREDELLRRFALELAQIGRAVSAYGDILRTATGRNARQAIDDDARLRALMTRAGDTKRAIGVHMAILIVDLLFLAVLLALRFDPRLGRRRA